ncbi:MAG: hypothetical protein AAGA36_02615 [Pseudomonadota bacterium]
MRCLVQLFAVAVFLTAAPAWAQSGVFQNMRPGDAVLIGTASAGFSGITSVKLDPVCETDIDGPLNLQITDALALQGISVDAQGLVVLRYETAPCDSGFAGKPNLAKQDAFEGNSRAYELPKPARPFEYEFGKREKAGARLTINMLVFKPGQAPLWNAVVAGRSPGADTPDYFAQMVAFALKNIGSDGTTEFEILRAGQTP